MADKKFNVGDVVELKSGGPTMTVESCNERDNVKCAYFLEGKAVRVDFIAGMLRLYEEAQDI